MLPSQEFLGVLTAITAALQTSTSQAPGQLAAAPALSSANKGKGAPHPLVIGGPDSFWQTKAALVGAVGKLHAGFAGASAALVKGLAAHKENMEDIGLFE